MPLYDNLGYGGEKTTVVFDIGAAYTKCGFAGEISPRCIIPSSVFRQKTNQTVNIHSVTKSDELYGVLVDFVHLLYFRHVLVNPKDRRVVVVESVLTPSVFRETLAKVLFKHYEAPSILFAPSHLVALFTLGIPSALVMDAGYSETLVLPVYEDIPIIKGCQSLPLAAKAIHNYLEAQLKECATVRENQDENKPVASVLDSLEENVLEDIKAKCCFVTNLSRAKQIQSVYAGKDGAEIPAPPPDVEYPLGGSRIMNIPGKIREHTCEVLFEQDNEEKSIATLLLDSVLQCPIDIRRTLVENIVLIGGTSMIPGFKHRIHSELNDLINKQKYSDELAVKCFKFHTLPGKENTIAWLGGATFGALEILATRSVTRDQYNLNNQMLPDWCSLFEYEEKDERAGVLLRKEASKDVPMTLQLTKGKSVESFATKAT